MHVNDFSDVIVMILFLQTHKLDCSKYNCRLIMLILSVVNYKLSNGDWGPFFVVHVV